MMNKVQETPTHFHTHTHCRGKCWTSSHYEFLLIDARLLSTKRRIIHGSAHRILQGRFHKIYARHFDRWPYCHWPRNERDSAYVGLVIHPKAFFLLRYKNMKFESQNIVFLEIEKHEVWIPSSKVGVSSSWTAAPTRAVVTIMIQTASYFFVFSECLDSLITSSTASRT